MTHGIRKRADVALDAIAAAKKRNDDMQAKCVVGSPAWHDHETIDDRLHEAIAAIDAD